MLSVRAKAGWMATLALLLGNVVVANTGDSLRTVPALTSKEWDDLNRGKVVSYGVSLAGMEGGQAWVVLPYRPEEVYALIRDVNRYPGWRADFRTIKLQKWISETEEEVGYVINLAGELNLTLRRVHEKNRYVWWTLKEGEIKATVGGYNLYPIDREQTLLEYHTAVDPGIWVPGFIKRAITTSNLPSSLQEFIPELERRYGHRERTPSDRPSGSTVPFCSYNCTPSPLPVSTPAEATSATR